MNVNEVYDYFGRNWSNVCRELKLGKNTSRAWVKKGYIPMPMQLKIEERTGGKLISDVNKIKE